jgi:formylglycine-generating enzyme required for sulfatase activity
MSQCLNPDCLHQNEAEIDICEKCGRKLLIGDRYRALTILGKGGFGRTFLAIDEFKPSKPKCVIKQFLPKIQSKKAAQLFAQEAIRLDDLGKHSQIPELLAYLNQEERQYLVQEFVDGDNLLQELSKQGAFNEQQIRELILDMLSVLQFVHANNVIHRDIKPENIIRRKRDNKLILVDFGAAKAAELDNLGMTGTVIGSAGYVAPEQSRGKTQFSSDLYSLGVTCLHLVTNVAPLELFDLGEDCWVWRDYLTECPVSEQLGQVLDKLVENATKKRFPSVEAVLEALSVHSSQASERVDAVNELSTSVPSLAPVKQGLDELASEIAETSIPPESLSSTPQPMPRVAKKINVPPPPPSPKISSAAKSIESAKVVTPQQPATATTKTQVKSFEFETATLSRYTSAIGKKAKWQAVLNRRKAKCVAIELGEGLTIDLVAIPGGKFLIGSPETEAERGIEESPQQEIIVPPFLLGRYPITQAQWQALMKNNPSRFQKNDANNPVERVSWMDCLLFCQKLSQLVGKTFRLPSEAEWEYAARAGTTTAFYCGVTLITELANYNGDFVYGTGMEGENRRQTVDVTSFPANPFGVYDLLGNVAEWCADTWHDSYDGIPVDGSAWVSGNEKEPRLLRGGSWLNVPGCCRSASRLKALPNIKSDAFGFRIAASIWS